MNRNKSQRAGSAAPEQMELRQISKELRSLHLKVLQARAENNTELHTQLKERQRILSAELQRRRAMAADTSKRSYTKSAKYL